MKRVGLVIVFLVFDFILFAQEAVHKVGDKFGGGIIFYLTSDGQHGAIVEAIDVGFLVPDSMFGLKDLDRYFDLINNPKYHTAEGQKYYDWRLPTIFELELIQKQKDIIGGFSLDPKAMYISDYFMMYLLLSPIQAQMKAPPGVGYSALSRQIGIIIKDGSQHKGNLWEHKFCIRMVRTF